MIENDSSAFCRLPRAIVLMALVLFSSPVTAEAGDIEALKRRVAELETELAAARAALAEAVALSQDPQSGTGIPAVDAMEETSQPASTEFRIGALTIGGAMRINYIRGSYTGGGDGPSRGGDGGNFELDTFRINLALDQGPLLGRLEYRWYDGYNFLHTGWLGYQFDNSDQVQVGLTRVPFGPGPYGISQSWFFDQHYYLGLADDSDLGVKYLLERGSWSLDLAYFVNGGGNWNGASEDSARYSYDPVKWTGSVDQSGNVSIDGVVNGYQERNQVNARLIRHFSGDDASTELGFSLQAGQLKGYGVDDGHQWAASVHMVNLIGRFRLASQLTRYEMHVDQDSPWGTDELIPMGAYDFAWPAAARAWLPAVSVSARFDTPGIGWLDYVLPYLEYSNIIKDDGDFSDSQMVTMGAAWSRGGWYIYSDLVYSNGNLFIGNRGDDYSNLFNGVGDFGVTGNDRWNYRFNINFGYYF